MMRLKSCTLVLGAEAESHDTQASMENSTDIIISRHFKGTSRVEINAGWEGWLAPAQFPFQPTLKVGNIERGQATLPNLQLITP